MGEFLNNYLSGVLIGATLLFLSAGASGLYVSFRMYQSIQRIEPLIEDVRYIQQRQQQHEAALLQLAKHTDYDVKELLEIINNAPYRGDYKDQ